MTCDVLLGHPAWEVSVAVLAATIAQAHEPQDRMAFVAGKSVRRAEGKVVSSLGEVTFWLCRVGLLSLQGGCQLPEGGV